MRDRWGLGSNGTKNTAKACFSELASRSGHWEDHCTKDPLCNDLWTTVHQGIACCINVLQNEFYLQ